MPITYPARTWVVVAMIDTLQIVYENGEQNDGTVLVNRSFSCRILVYLELEFLAHPPASAAKGGAPFATRDR